MFNWLKKVAPPVLISLLLIAHSSSLIAIKNVRAAETEETFYYLHDHLGGIEAVLDEEGNVVERRDYLPFGSERVSVGEPGENYGFTGKELDNETGLMYYDQRYYDAEIGRFVQIDPLVLGESSKPLESVLTNPQALNSYSYVTNNPLRYVDEEGEYKSDFHYTLTYYLALKAGLDNSTASEIAFFNDRMDTDPATAPVSSNNVINGTTWNNHFIWETEARKRVDNAIKTKDVRAFGKALHTFQDAAGSHNGITQIQHAYLTKIEEWFGYKTDPDETVNNVQKAFSVSTGTFLYIRELKLQQLNLTDENEIDKYYQETLKIWGDISSNVMDYLSTEDKSETTIKKDIDKEVGN